MRTKTFLVAAALASLTLACDDDDNNITSPGTGGTGAGSTCTQTVVAEQQMTVDGGRTAVPFTTSQAGRVDITVDWTNSSGRVGAFVAQANSCNDEQFSGGSCTFAGRSAGTGGGTDASAAFTSKPGRFSVPNAAAGNWELLLTSYGAQDDDDDDNNDEAIALQVVSSVGSGCPAFPPAS